MDVVFETFEYSKFQDVNETIATTWLSIFIVEIHMKKQHKAQFGISPFAAVQRRGWPAGRIFAALMRRCKRMIWPQKRCFFVLSRRTIDVSAIMVQY
jgi:hypothetical protein